MKNYHLITKVFLFIYFVWPLPCFVLIDEFTFLKLLLSYAVLLMLMFVVRAILTIFDDEDAIKEWEKQKEALKKAIYENNDSKNRN